MIALMTKQYMYRIKCFKKQLDFKHLIVELQTIYSYEHYYAKQSGKLSIHHKKWKPMYPQSIEPDNSITSGELFQNILQIYNCFLTVQRAFPMFALTIKNC